MAPNTFDYHDTSTWTDEAIRAYIRTTTTSKPFFKNYFNWPEEQWERAVRITRLDLADYDLPCPRTAHNSFYPDDETRLQRLKLQDGLLGPRHDGASPFACRWRKSPTWYSDVLTRGRSRCEVEYQCVVQKFISYVIGAIRAEQRIAKRWAHGGTWWCKCMSSLPLMPMSGKMSNAKRALPDTDEDACSSESGPSDSDEPPALRRRIMPRRRVEETAGMTTTAIASWSERRTAHSATRSSVHDDKTSNTMANTSRERNTPRAQTIVPREHPMQSTAERLAVLERLCSSLASENFQRKELHETLEKELMESKARLQKLEADAGAHAQQQEQTQGELSRLSLRVQDLEGVNHGLRNAFGPFA